MGVGTKCTKVCARPSQPLDHHIHYAPHTQYTCEYVMYRGHVGSIMISKFEFESKIKIKILIGRGRVSK
jgi:hypothetical protein